MYLVLRSFMFGGGTTSLCLLHLSILPLSMGYRSGVTTDNLQFYQVGGLKASHLPNALHEGGGYRVINHKHHNRSATDGGTPHMHTCDVDARLAEQCAHLSDNSRAIRMLCDDHISVRHDVHMVAINMNDVWLVAVDGAADNTFSCGCMRMNGKQAGVVGGGLTTLFQHTNTAHLGEIGRVDEIDPPVMDGKHKPVEHGSCDGGSRQIAEIAVKNNLYSGDGVLFLLGESQLHLKVPNGRSKPLEWL